jgi:hypothetical protein
MSRFTKPIALLTAILLALAPLPLPYGYYQFLRVIVCAVSVSFGIVFFARHRDDTEKVVAWIIMGVGLLWNPFLPVHLPKSIWMIFDLVAAGFFVWISFRRERAFEAQ